MDFYRGRTAGQTGGRGNRTALLRHGKTGGEVRTVEHLVLKPSKAVAGDNAIRIAFREEAEDLISIRAEGCRGAIDGLR